MANRLAHASQGAKSAGSRIMGPLENRGEIACFARKSPQNQRQPHRLFHPSLHFSKHSSLILKRGFISQICTYFAHLFSKSPKMYDFYGSEPLQKKSKFCAVPPTPRERDFSGWDHRCAGPKFGFPAETVVVWLTHHRGPKGLAHASQVAKRADSRITPHPPLGPHLGI